MIRVLFLNLVGVLLFWGCEGQKETPPIITGNSTTGIAAAYPGDRGIGDHPSVILADDFEDYSSASELTRKWSNLFQSSNLRITAEQGNFFAGSKAVQMTLPQTSVEISNAITKILTNKVDVLYLRYYSKFESNFNIVGSSHNGGEISANYNVNGQATPGIPANGTNKFLVMFENWRGETSTQNPGFYNIYTYRPGQRSEWGDHLFPDGIVAPFTSTLEDWGPGFVPRENIIPELNRWYSHELMVKANTPGERDGRISCWIDGVLIADFPNLRLRDIDTLKIDHFSVSFHAHSSPNTTRKWYDNIVAATEYIGPMAAP